MRDRLPGWAFIVFLALMPGCRTERSDGATTRVRDSVGVRIVENMRPVWEPSTEWRVGPPDLVLGADSATSVLFTSPIQVLVLRDGALLVVDRGADRIALFDSAGRFVRDVAGKGQGPGEVLQPYAAWLTAGDTIVTWDFGNRRAQYLTRAGQLVRTIRPATTAAGASVFPISVLSNGNLLTLSREVPHLTSAEPIREQAPYYHVSGDDGRLLDSLGTYPDLERYTLTLEIGGQRVPQRQVVAFMRWTDAMAIGSDAYLIADNATYELREVGLDGRVRRIIRVTTQPVPVSEEAIAWGRAEFERVMRADKSLPADLTATLIAENKKGPHAPTFPAYGQVVQGSDGSYWVEEYQWRPDSTARAYRVFDPEGVLLGSVEMAQGETLMAAEPGYVVSLGTRDDGVMEIRRRPLIRGSRPSAVRE